jgi:hypothetical protein
MIEDSLPDQTEQSKNNFEIARRGCFDFLGGHPSRWLGPLILQIGIRDPLLDSCEGLLVRFRRSDRYNQRERGRIARATIVAARYSSLSILR